MVLSLTKNGRATFWATFSQTHPVTDGYFCIFLKLPKVNNRENSPNLVTLLLPPLEI
jgi:hypothetical protein